jgi:hypothetical protein
MDNSHLLVNRIQLIKQDKECKEEEKLEVIQKGKAIRLTRIIVEKDRTA